MSDFTGSNHSFKARITFLGPAENGRKYPAVQGYRPDFFYADDRRHGWVIWPRFLDEHGNQLPDGATVPLECDAFMYVLDDTLRRTVHQQRLKVGATFLVSEGVHVVANGVVLEITGLFDS